jgi:hypothetical protein
VIIQPFTEEFCAFQSAKFGHVIAKRSGCLEGSAHHE